MAVHFQAHRQAATIEALAAGIHSSKSTATSRASSVVYLDNHSNDKNSTRTSISSLDDAKKGSKSKFLSKIVGKQN